MENLESKVERARQIVKAFALFSEELEKKKSEDKDMKATPWKQVWRQWSMKVTYPSAQEKDP